MTTIRQLLVSSLLVGCLHPPPGGLDIVRQDKRQTGYRYRLCDTISHPTAFQGYTLRYRYVRLESDGLLTLERGFQWNGPSFTPDAGAFMRASAFHDALYRMFRARDLPPEEQFRADQVLHDVAEEDGYLAAGLVLVGVTAFGWMGTRAHPKGDELTTAPVLATFRQGCQSTSPGDALP